MADCLNTRKDTSSVQPEEMLDARQWLTRMLEVLTTVEEVHVAWDMQPEIVCLSQGWGEMQLGVSMDKTPLCLAGRVYPSGLGTHADSEIVVRLPIAAQQLTGWCGVNDSPVTRNTRPLTFTVEVDNTVVWQSGPQNAAVAPARVDVDLSGCTQFTLKVTGPINYAHADWVDLHISLTNGTSIEIGRPKAINPGFSFQYGGELSTALLPTWGLMKEQLPEKDGIVLHRVTRTDPKTGLAVVCEIKEYTTFPVVEWSLRLKNTSQHETPVLENIQSLDISSWIGPFPYLNYWNGDYCQPDGYEPFRVSLAHGEAYRFAPVGGRPTDRAWPYYNIDATGRGLIVVVGWPGQWTARFCGLDNQGVHITAGQELTHFKLLSGEEVSTPLSVLMFYRGDLQRSQNQWRCWMHAHNLPRPNGQPLKPLLACIGTDDGEEFTGATETNQIRYIEQFQERGIHPDVWWIDAGWYPCYNHNHERKWGVTGTWEPDPERFPRGLKPVSDCATRNGADLLLWFEPERVAPGSQIDIAHPDWLLKIDREGDRLLNLGNPACRQWLTDHVCRLIQDNGIQIYRQDFNFCPLEYWRKNEAEDRQGINENLHVQGYLQYWDDLLTRNPRLWIDSCASGGRRNDLETMRRSVPLHYTDYGYGDHPVKLAFQHALYTWLPYFKEFTLSWDLGGNARFDHQVDSFSFHCAMAPMLFATLDIRRDDYDFSLAGTMITIWRRASHLLLYGDYYLHTPSHRCDEKWVVRQFDSPASGCGLIQAIRLAASPQETFTIYPHGMSPNATYVFENAETGETRDLAGEVLRRHGFSITLQARSGAIWFYGQRPA